MKQITHKHHIIPRHAGGSDDPSNIVELTIEEHAEAHRKLYEEHGRWQDKLAWLGLSNNTGNQEARLLAIREGIKTRDMSYFQTEAWKQRVRSWMTNRTISEETILKMSKPKTPEHRQKLQKHLIEHNKRERSADFKQKMSDSVKNTRKTCPHCSFESTASHVTRHIKRAHVNV